MKFTSVLFILSSFFIVFLTACTSSGQLSNMEEKILGTWEFEEVKFQPKDKNSYADYSDGFQGSSVTFKAGGIMEAYDKDLDTLASGYWYIDYYEEYDSEGDTKKTIYYMVGTLDIPALDIYDDLLWDELSITNRRLNAIEKDKNNGRYKYRLVR